MTKINLRDYYPSHYKTDYIIDVPDEVAATMLKHDRLDAAYQRRTYYHHAHYSLDRGDGIEYEAVFRSASPCEIYERKVTMEQLHAAIAALPDKQAKRITAHYFLGLPIKAIVNRKLKTITADHLQSYIDLLIFGGIAPDGTKYKPHKVGSMRRYSAVLQNTFRFAVFPKGLITFNPMQYVVIRSKGEDYELFAEDGAGDIPNKTPTITHEQYLKLTEYLVKNNNPALLPIQISYFTGLRVGEACGLTWQDNALFRLRLIRRQFICCCHPNPGIFIPAF